MFSGKHGIYQPLIVKDMQIRVEAPPQVKLFIERNESFDRSGDNLRGEGGDYVTEVENKHLKSHLSPGVPTLSSWVNASRNHETLTKNWKAVFERAGMEDPSQQESSVFKFSKEIQMFRGYIRESGLLENPYELVSLRNIDGEPLHPDLVNFYFQCCENYRSYLNDPETELVPIFVTKDEEAAFNNISNWTNSKLISKCEEFVASMIDPINQSRYLSLLEKIRRARKNRILEFYRELEDVVMNQNIHNEEILCDQEEES